ncbi:MAG: glycosyltransferase family 2 protein [Candidatus Omnitrophica bacterium]|nr:glycosyltransferase family 2 protein [Candidatus Omnitrophota bacterium]
MEKLSESISLIIPVYNEKKLIRPCLLRCLEALSRDFKDFEIILVDDGSTDETAEAIEEMRKNDERIKVIYNIINLNVGISIQRGLASAKKDFVLHNAVDLPLAPEDVAGLIPVLKNCDLLVLERKSYPGYTVWRWVVSRINRILLRILFPFISIGIKDFNFTQIYRRNILPGIMPLSKSPAFSTPEMILRARYNSLRVKSIVINYRPRTMGKSAFGKPHDMLWSLYDMLRFRIKYKGKR